MVVEMYPADNPLDRTVKGGRHRLDSGGERLLKYRRSEDPAWCLSSECLISNLLLPGLSRAVWSFACCCSAGWSTRNPFHTRRMITAPAPTTKRPMPPCSVRGCVRRGRSWRERPSRYRRLVGWSHVSHCTSRMSRLPCLFSPRPPADLPLQSDPFLVQAA
jgi:hypothetical protein